MQYTQLGQTGIRVSKLGLGGAPIGGDFASTMTDEIAVRTIHAAIDHGITFLDTAPLYGRGESERRFGLALRGKRDRVVLATKAVMRGDPYTYENTMKSVEDSLRRLQTDYIDLIQLHELETCGAEMGMNETLPAFLKLKEQGKVRAIGVNAGRTEMLQPFIESGLIDTVQTYAKYTLIDYAAKDVLFPLTRKHGVSVIHGSPLWMGILADRPAQFLLKNPAMLAEAERRKELLGFLRQGSGEPGGFIEPAMRFCLGCPDIAVTLTGASSPEEVAQNVKYCDGVGLGADVEERVLSLFPGRALNE